MFEVAGRESAQTMSLPGVNFDDFYHQEYRAMLRLAIGLVEAGPGGEDLLEAPLDGRLGVGGGRHPPAGFLPCVVVNRCGGGFGGGGVSRDRRAEPVPI